MKKILDKLAGGNAAHFPLPTTDKKSGFTIMELLVVFTIMFVIFAIVLGAMSNFSKRQAFKTTVLDVRDGVMEMRQRTLASVNDTLYGVHVSSTAVVFFDGIDFTEGSASNTTITLLGSISATTSFTGDVTTATFTRLTGVPSATGTIVIFDTVNNNSATITISATGLVE